MAESALTRHPIRGGIWGIPTGLGLGLLAVNSQKFALSISTFVIFGLLGVAVGALWASFGPAKKPKGAPPEDVAAQPQPLNNPVAYQATADPAPLAPPPQSPAPGSLAPPPARPLTDSDPGASSPPI